MVVRRGCSRARQTSTSTASRRVIMALSMPMPMLTVMLQRPIRHGMATAVHIPYYHVGSIRRWGLLLIVYNHPIPLSPTFLYETLGAGGEASRPKPLPAPQHHEKTIVASAPSLSLSNLTPTAHHLAIPSCARSPSLPHAFTACISLSHPAPTPERVLPLCRRPLAASVLGPPMPTGPTALSVPSSPCCARFVYFAFAILRCISHRHLASHARNDPTPCAPWGDEAEVSIPAHSHSIPLPSLPLLWRTAPGSRIRSRPHRPPTKPPSAIQYPRPPLRLASTVSLRVRSPVPAQSISDRLHARRLAPPALPSSCDATWSRWLPMPDAFHGYQHEVISGL